MNTYETKQEARRERLERAAARKRDESNAAATRAHAATSMIPMGQPILVDHHSAPRHRNAIRKSDNAMRKAIETDKQAKRLQERADAVGSGGISSDDPDALAKLDDKRTDLERERDRMKLVNKLYKAGDVSGLAALGVDYEATRARITRLHAYDNVPFQSFEFTNLSARIRAAKKRSAVIESVQAMEDSTTEVAGATVAVDVEDNRVTIKFPARLSKPGYSAMRSYGFVWSPTRSGFTRKLSGCSKQYAEGVARRIAAIESPTTEGN